MDSYFEQIVVKVKTGADIAKMVLLSAALVLAASFCMYASIVFGLTFLVLAAVGLLALAVWLLSGMNVEYEYIVTNDEMDVDKIIGRRKRKRMITVELGKSEDFGALPTEKDIDADTTVHATSGLEKDAHYLLVQHKDYGKVKIIFNPNEKIREAIAQGLPKALSARLKHNVK